MFQGLLQKQLAQAIKDQSLFKIKSLLMAGVKPDEENEVLGSSAIDYATHKGYTQITNLLLSKAGYDKLTSKHIEELVHEGSAVYLKEIFEKLPKKLSKYEFTQPLPLIAIHHRDQGMLELLNANDVNFSFVDNYDRNLVFYATEDGAPELIDFFKSININPDQKDVFSVNVLEYAGYLEQKNVVEKLDSEEINRQHGLSWEEQHVFKVVKENRYEEVGVALGDPHIHVEIINEFGHSPLHVAAAYGVEKSMMVLLQSAKNIDMLDKHGRTALHVALIFGKSELVNLLVNQGAKLDVADKNGLTPQDFINIYQQG